MTFQFESVSAFFAMGGYSFYVWLSYGVTFIAMGILIWQSQREQRAVFEQTKKAIEREERLKSQL